MLIGISPSGIITFVSKLYAGSISDKELTRCSGIMDLLQPGDSVMANRGFDIQDDLALRGVRLNISPFLKGSPNSQSQSLWKQGLHQLGFMLSRLWSVLRIFIFLIELYLHPCPT